MVANTSAPKAARKLTAGPNGSFPIGDATHAALAIGAATRSERAGNISASVEADIKSKARKKLGHPGGNLGDYLHDKHDPMSPPKRKTRRMRKRMP